MPLNRQTTLARNKHYPNALRNRDIYERLAKEGYDVRSEIIIRLFTDPSFYRNREAYSISVEWTQSTDYGIRQYAVDYPRICVAHYSRLELKFVNDRKNIQTIDELLAQLEKVNTPKKHVLDQPPSNEVREKYFKNMFFKRKMEFLSPQTMETYNPIEFKKARVDELFATADSNSKKSWENIFHRLVDLEKTFY